MKALKKRVVCATVLKMVIKELMKTLLVESDTLTFMTVILFSVVDTPVHEFPTPPRFIPFDR